MKYRNMFMTTILLAAGSLASAQQPAEKPALTQAENIAYLEKNKKDPEVKVTESGLQYKIIKEGTGERPSPDSKVRITFSLSLINGKKIAGAEKEKPWEHHLDKGLAAWREAVPMMKIGAKWILTIPAVLGFGDGGEELGVPAGSTLICEIELLGVL